MPPVLERELRVQARSWATTGLRLLAGGLALIGFYLTAVMSEAFGEWHGREMFLSLHAATCFFAALLCPLLTADSILRERREGTLPLLFLTPLSANEILVGKFLAQLLRAGSLWLAASPVLLLPILSGGVGWQSVVVMLGLEMLLIPTALLVGLAASAHSESYFGAVFIGYTVLGGLMLFGGLPTVGVLNSMGSTPSGGELAVFGLVMLVVWSVTIWALLSGTAGQIRDCWRQGEPMPTPGSAFTATDATVPAYQPTWYETWMERRRQAQAPQLTVCSSVAAARGASEDQADEQAIHRRLINRHRERSKLRPLEWLWTRHGYLIGLMVLEAFFVGFSALLTLPTGGPGWGLAIIQMLLASYPSVRALKEERQSGSLELLLTTPLGAKEYLLSHCQCIWKLFGPGVAVYGAAVFGAGVLTGRWEGLAPLAWCLTAMLALPIVGFWLTFWLSSPVLSVLVLNVGLLLVPMFLGAMLLELLTIKPSSRDWPVLLLSVSFMAIFSLLAGVQSMRWLSRRKSPRRLLAYIPA